MYEYDDERKNEEMRQTVPNPPFNLTTIIPISYTLLLNKLSDKTFIIPIGNIKNIISPIHIKIKSKKPQPPL